MSKRFAILYSDGSMNVFSKNDIGGKKSLEHVRQEWSGDEGDQIVTFDLPDEAIVPYATRSK